MIKRTPLAHLFFNGRLLTVLLLTAALYTSTLSSCRNARPDAKEISNPNECTQYKCPMHPDHTSTVPAKCPECNMDMTPVDPNGKITKRDSAKSQ